VPGADWYKRAQQQRLEPEREMHYPVHSGLALHLITGLSTREFDVCAVREIAREQYEGHAYSYIHRTYLAERDLPIVPIMLNTYYPPNPVTPKRCVQLGAALKALIEDFPENMRVGVIASGGLSHFVVDEELDRGVLKALQEKDIDYLAQLDPKRLQAGSSEIRSWIATAAAATDLNLVWSDYTPAYRTPALTGTGLAFARWA
jgi:3-O-methylgallate 3,4-dioxygenase